MKYSILFYSRTDLLSKLQLPLTVGSLLCFSIANTPSSVLLCFTVSLPWFAIDKDVACINYVYCSFFLSHRILTGWVSLQGVIINEVKPLFNLFIPNYSVFSPIESNPGSLTKKSFSYRKGYCTSPTILLITRLVPVYVLNRTHSFPLSTHAFSWWGIVSKRKNWCNHLVLFRLEMPHHIEFHDKMIWLYCVKIFLDCMYSWIIIWLYNETYLKWYCSD